MMISLRRGAHDHAVRVERGRGHRASAVLAQKAAVRLDAGELLAVEVEDLDDVGGCAAVVLIDGLVI